MTKSRLETTGLALSQFGISPGVLLNYTDDPNRYYHTWKHIEAMIKAAEADTIMTKELFLAIVFHDIVYDPLEKDNEESSADFLRQVYKGDDVERIAAAIMDTKTHQPTSGLGDLLCKYDMQILESDPITLMDYEYGIFKEYQYADWNEYKKERLKFLRSLPETKAIDFLIRYVETRKPNIGVFAGSFDPFHPGHYNILEKAEKIFDKVIIARGENPEKQPHTWPMPQKIKYRQFVDYKGELTDFIKELEYPVTLIRGLRNADDLKHEMTHLKFLRDFMPEISTISIICDPEYREISSTAIRNLKKVGKEGPYLLD